MFCTLVNVIALLAHLIDRRLRKRYTRVLRATRNSVRAIPIGEGVNVRRTKYSPYAAYTK